jgi:hypothetical protein
MAGVVNLSPGRPFGLRAAILPGKPKEKDLSFPGVRASDEIVFVLAIDKGSTTTDRTAEASITAPGKVQFSTDTSGELLTVVVHRPNP